MGVLKLGGVPKDLTFVLCDKLTEVLKNGGLLDITFNAEGTYFVGRENKTFFKVKQPTKERV